MKASALFAPLFALSACGTPSSPSATMRSAETPAFVAGDKLSCFDDVSLEKSTIKITSTTPWAAYVRFEGRDGKRFYPAKNVVANLIRGELVLEMHGAAGAESLTLPAALRFGFGAAVYADGGDSRPLDCTVERASTNTAEYVEVARLDYADTEALVKHPGALGSEIPSSVIEIFKDARMAQDYQALKAAVRAHAWSTEEAERLMSTIHTEVYQQGEQLTMWVSADADDRGESSFSFTIEYDLAARAISSWSSVVFTDHP